MNSITHNNKLYNIEAIIPKKKKNYIQTTNWGEFSVYKEFAVTHPQIKRDNIYGYLIQ